MVLTCQVSNHAWEGYWIFSRGIHPPLAHSSCTASLCLISTGRCSWTVCILAWTWSPSRRRWSHSFIHSPANDSRGSMPWTTNKGDHMVDLDIPVFAANSAKWSNFTQSSCRWLTNSQRYCPIVAFFCSVWPSISEWNAVNILRWIPKWLLIWPQNVEVNCGPRFKTIVNGSQCSHTTSLKDHSTSSNASILV